MSRCGSYHEHQPLARTAHPLPRYRSCWPGSTFHLKGMCDPEMYSITSTSTNCCTVYFMEWIGGRSNDFRETAYEALTGGYGSRLCGLCSCYLICCFYSTFDPP